MSSIGPVELRSDGFDPLEVPAEAVTLVLFERGRERGRRAVEFDAAGLARVLLLD